MAEPTYTRQQTTLRDFLNVVFRRKWLILSIIGLVTVVVFYLNTRKPLVYESVSRILVRRGEQSDVITGSVRYLGWAEEVSSQIQVILSDDVFAEASRMFADSVEAHGLPKEWRFLPGSVRADVVGESNAFVISYVNTNPGVCRLGCEVMTIAFQEYYRERKSPPALSDFFVDQISDTRDQLEHWRERRTEFLNREQFYGADETARVLMNKMDNLESSLLDFNQRVNSQQLRVENMKVLAAKSGAELEEDIAFAPSQGGVMSSGIVQNIKFSLQNLRMRKEDLTHRYTDKHPEVLAVTQQIEDLRRDLKLQVENTLQVEQLSLQELKENRAKLVEGLATTRKEWDAIPDRDRQLTEFEGQIRRLEGELSTLLQRQSETEIAVASRQEWEVDILTHAGPPFARRTRDYVRMALGPMLAAVVALGVAFFMESLDHSLKNMAEVEEYLDRKVLATISEFRK
jgi:uncharacterized protein involved in exopolysaccharide biosynthesis